VSLEMADLDMNLTSNELPFVKMPCMVKHSREVKQESNISQTLQHRAWFEHPRTSCS
jgi:hypothetical protein